MLFMSGIITLQEMSEKNGSPGFGVKGGRFWCTWGMSLFYASVSSKY
jgi:hypothetical protein